MTAPAIASMSEAEWQEQFIQLAHLHGWRHMFVRRSRGKGGGWTTATNVPGWPDLYLWNERQERAMHVELKAEKGVVSPDQDDVLWSLIRARVETYVFRPSDLDRALAALAPVEPVAKWLADLNAVVTAHRIPANLQAAIERLRRDVVAAQAESRRPTRSAVEGEEA